MPQNYVVIGGGAYQPGSAAAKKAQELFNQWQRNNPPSANPNAVPGGITNPPQGPTNFPSYPSGTLSGAVPGTSASLAPAPATGGKGAFGLIPQVPNPISTAAGGIGGNIANLGSLGQLGTGTTQLAANLGAMPFQMNLPGYGGMLGQSSQNISSNLAGVVDPAEWTQLQTRMGERGAAMGLGPGSPNSNTALAIALDRDIRQQQALGQQQLNAAIGRTPTGQQFNIAGQQLSPADMQSAQWAANVMGAAPDPTQAAQANLDMLLKAIEAGRVGGWGGAGGGLPGYPRLTTPGVGLSPVSPGYTFSAPGYAPRQAPLGPSAGASPGTGDYYGGFVNPQNPLVDYSRAPGGGQYPVDVGNQLDYPDQGIDSSVTPGGTPYPTDYTDFFNGFGNEASAWQNYPQYDPNGPYY